MKKGKFQLGAEGNLPMLMSTLQKKAVNVVDSSILSHEILSRKQDLRLVFN